MKYFVLTVGRLLHWESSPADGGRYDMSQSCPRCGTGAVRIDPLFVAPSRCLAGVAGTYLQQILVSKDVYEQLFAVGVRSLRQAVDRKGREPVDFWSLEPERSLSPWSKDSSGFERSEMDPPCSKCHRDGYYDIPKQSLKLSYDSMPPVQICATWEHFGASRLRVPFEKSLFATPRFIVSELVHDVLCSCQGIGFDEVRITAPNQSSQPTRAFGPRG